MPPFVLFDQTHLISLLLTYGLITILTLYVKSFSQEKIKYARVSLGVLLITHACLQLFYGYQFIWWEALPLHMCDFSKVAIGLYLLGYGPRFFHCAFFWGIIPASMALITPALTYSFPYPEYINFFYGHGLILLGVSVGLFVLNERPYFKDFLFVTGITILLTIMIYIINLMLGDGANFWYLIYKPNGDTIMNLFPDAPWHIFALVPTAIFAFFLTYLPLLIKDKIK
jgi:hypothetical integral membrane protein (TIGR02206 family)